MISYGKQSIDQSDIDAVIEVLKSDWLTQGPKVEAFENDLKSYFGSKYACAVSNGTAALHLTGIALGWKEGDIVITSPITFLASANCIVYSGATPDFVDINKKTYTIDPNLVEEKVKYYKSKGLNVKAIIGVDFAGHPCDWKALRSIADRYELQLINDNCHAMGASYFDDKKYAVKYADVVTHSYHPVKQITAGEGGAILTNSKKIDEKVKIYRTHGMEKDSNSSKNSEPWYYEMHELGYNYRLTDFQCALGSSQLRKLDQFIIERNKIANYYSKIFKENLLIKIPKVSEEIKHAFHLYPLLVDFSQLKIRKSLFFLKLESKNIKLQVHYIPVHLQPFYKKNYGFKDSNFPIAKKFYQDEISIPIYPSLTEKNQNLFISTFLKYLK